MVGAACGKRPFECKHEFKPFQTVWALWKNIQVAQFPHDFAFLLVHWLDTNRWEGAAHICLCPVWSWPQISTSKRAREMSWLNALTFAKNKQLTSPLAPYECLSEFANNHEWTVHVGHHIRPFPHHHGVSLTVHLFPNQCKLRDVDFVSSIRGHVWQQGRGLNLRIIVILTCSSTYSYIAAAAAWKEKVPNVQRIPHLVVKDFGWCAFIQSLHTSVARHE